MSDLTKNIALPLLVLGFYPLIKIISTLSINIPISGSDADISLKFLEYLWAIIMATTVSVFYYRSRK